jgi:hypothetical protein
LTGIAGEDVQKAAEAKAVKGWPRFSLIKLLWRSFVHAGHRPVALVRRAQPARVEARAVLRRGEVARGGPAPVERGLPRPLRLRVLRLGELRRRQGFADALRRLFCLGQLWTR